MFDLSISGDQRYLPFEGTGAISGWALQLARAINTIHIDSISDVISA